MAQLLVVCSVVFSAASCDGSTSRVTHRTTTSAPPEATVAPPPWMSTRERECLELLGKQLAASTSVPPDLLEQVDACADG